jgi:hypothetical protein
MTCSFYVAGENIGAARLKNKMARINLLEGDFHMRLNEFADPSPYTLSTDDATKFLEQFGRVMNYTSVWRQSFLAPRVGHHFGGTHRRIRHRAVQWPPAQPNVAQSLPYDATNDH